MFIRGEDITFDGTECNKIGASYTALRGQNNKCQMQPKSCFKNQLEDRYNEDIKRTSQGKSPLHFIEQYGNFSMILSSNVTYLQLGMQGRYSSLVTLEVNGDSLRYVTNLSDGKIDYAYLPNFEALSGDGELETQISNIGNVAAQYILGILCDDGVSPLGAQTVSLKAMESKILNFDIQVESTDSNEYFCNITLYNSIGSVVDSYPIYFNTTTRHTDTGTQGGNGGKQTGDNITDSSTSGCSDSCPQ